MKLEQIQISAKNLGELNNRNYCKRCFWLKTTLRNRLPYQIFPGIFSSIDAYTKKMVETHFDQKGEAPDWIKQLELGELAGYIKTTRTTFFIEDEESGIKLTGDPDQIFKAVDGSAILIDYKTSKVTKTQDEMYPIYEFQLNGYRKIAEHIGLPAVSKLALVYTEPQTDQYGEESVLNESGFHMNFMAAVKPVHIKEDLVKEKMHKAREIMNSGAIPRPRKFVFNNKEKFCNDCVKMEGVFKTMNAIWPK